MKNCKNYRPIIFDSNEYLLIVGVIVIAVIVTQEIKNH